MAGSYISKNFSGKTIALLSDGSRYGNGLVLGTKKSMKGKYAKVMTIALAQNQSDFSRLVSQLKKSKVDFVFWGGLAKQLGLIVRRMREEGVEATVMCADGIADFEYSTFGGPGVTGTLMTFAADPQKRPEAAAVVKNMTANGFRPEAYTLYAYASVEVLKQAAEKAKSLDPKIISKMIKTGMEFNTVLGKFTYNKKGDRENDDYAIYVWRKIDGRMGYVEK